MANSIYILTSDHLILTLKNTYIGYFHICRPALPFQSLEHIYLLGTCMSYTGSKIAQKTDAII